MCCTACAARSRNFLFKRAPRERGELTNWQTDALRASSSSSSSQFRGQGVIHSYYVICEFMRFKEAPAIMNSRAGIIRSCKLQVRECIYKTCARIREES